MNSIERRAQVAAASVAVRALLVSVALAAAAPASANLLANGGFEGAGFGGTFQFLSGANDLPGWSFTGDLADEPSYWWKDGHGGNTRFTAEGGSALMLNRGDTISQSFSTVAGQSYILSFYFQRLEATTLEVLVGGSQFDLGAGDGTETGLVVDTRFGGYNWREVSLQFTATAATSELRFGSVLSPTGSGWYLDGVVVESVPAPGAAALLGLAGAAARRRRR